MNDRPTKTIELAKAMINKSFETDFTSFLDSEASYQEFCGFYRRFQGGAFIEKRKPVFKVM